jgi:hypothetical protein
MVPGSWGAGTAGGVRQGAPPCEGELGSGQEDGAWERRYHGVREVLAVLDQRSRWLLLLAALLAGCASVPLASPEADAEARRAEVPEGKALIYIFRPTLAPPVTLYSTFVDGQMLGELARHSYYLVEVEPGTHRIAFPWRYDAETLTLKVEAGKRYFVHQWLERFPLDRPHLAQVSEAEGRYALGHLVRVVQLKSNREEARLARKAEPAPGRAQIYVFRWDWLAADKVHELEVGGRPAGRLPARSFVLADIEPGNVTVKLKGEDGFSVTLQVEPGSVTYVEASMILRELHTVSARHGKEIVAELHLEGRLGP